MNLYKTIQQDFNDRFDDFEHDKKLLDVFGDPFELSLEKAESNFKLELMNLQCDDKLKSKFRAGG